MENNMAGSSLSPPQSITDCYQNGSMFPSRELLWGGGEETGKIHNSHRPPPNINSPPDQLTVTSNSFFSSLCPKSYKKKPKRYIMKRKKH